METSWDTVFRDSTRFWVQFILVPVVVLIGVIGNSVTTYILTRKTMRIPSNVYLTALAISDLIFLVSTFTMSWKHYHWMKSVGLYWNYIPFGFWITDASCSTSVWLTVSFTIERYMAVCRPMVMKSPCTEKRAIIVASIVYTLCFLLTSSTPFEWRSVVVSSNSSEVTLVGTNTSDVAATGGNESDATIFVLENTELGKNSWYRFAYYWFSTIVFVLVPLIILAIGDFFLINAVRNSRKVREALTNSHVHRRQFQLMHQEDKITMTLIAIIIVFLICQLPTAIVLIYTAMHTPEPGSVEDNVLLGLGNIFNLLVAINAACNFILYTALSKNYRRVFLGVFGYNWLRRSWYRKWYPGRQVVYNVPGVEDPNDVFAEINGDNNGIIDITGQNGDNACPIPSDNVNEEEQEDHNILSSTGAYQMAGRDHLKRLILRSQNSVPAESAQPGTCRKKQKSSVAFQINDFHSV